MTASGADALHNVAVDNNADLEVTGGTLTLDQATAVANTGGTITVDSGATLALDTATVTDGDLAVEGTVAVTGNSTISNAGISNGDVTVATGAVLTLDGVTVDGTAITGEQGTGSIVAIDSDKQLTLEGGASLNDLQIGNDGTIAVSGAATLSGDALDNTQLTVDASATLTLTGTTITGGTITDDGTIDVTGNSKIDGNAALDGGAVHVESATLTLDDVTVDGTAITGEQGTGSIVAIDSDKQLTLEGGASLNDLQIGNDGTIAVSGAATLSGDALDNTQLTVDASATLTLTGTAITGGTIDGTDAASGGIVASDIEVTGTSSINDAAINHGDVTVASGVTLTLDNDTVTGVSFDDSAGGMLQVDAGKTLTLAGTTIDGGAFDNAGAVSTTGTTTIGAAIVNDGTFEVQSGVLDLTGSIAGTGSVQVDDGATLILDGSDSQAVSLLGAGGSALVINAGTFAGQIIDLGAGDTIDLTNIPYDEDTTATYAGNVLTVFNGASLIGLDLNGNYSGTLFFAGSNDGNGHTLVTIHTTDDAPVIDAGNKTESATFTELADTTGSSTSNPTPAVSGSIHFTDIDLLDRPQASIDGDSQAVTWSAADGVTDLSANLTAQQILDLEHGLERLAIRHYQQRQFRLELFDRRQRARLPGRGRDGGDRLEHRGRRPARRNRCGDRQSHDPRRQRHAGHHGGGCDGRGDGRLEPGCRQSEYAGRGDRQLPDRQRLGHLRRCDDRPERHS